MSGPHSLVALALLALALPGPFGLLPGLLAVLRPPWRAAAPGLLALAVLAWVGGPQPSGGVAPGAGAWRAHAIWGRGLQGPRLTFPTGPALPVRLATDLDDPGAGRPLEVLLRAGGRRPEVVAWRAVGPVGGAWLDRWQDAARGRVEALVHPERQGLVRALLLGDRAGLLDCDRRASRNTGTLHLLALSGLHVAILARGLQVLVRGGRARSQGLLLLGFVALTGARAPLRRALLGWVALRLGAARGRHAPALARLTSVAVVVLTFEPAWRADLGAWFSFLGVAGLLALARPGLAGVLAPCGAFLATAPLAAEHFGRLQPWGLLVTPLLVPVIAVQLAVGAVAVLPGPAFHAADGVLGPVLDGSAGVLQRALAHAERACPPPLQRSVPAGWGRPVGLAIVFALQRLRRGPR